MSQHPAGCCDIFTQEHSDHFPAKSHSACIHLMTLFSSNKTVLFNFIYELSSIKLTWMEKEFHTEVVFILVLKLLRQSLEKLVPNFARVRGLNLLAL